MDDRPGAEGGREEPDACRVDEGRAEHGVHGKAQERRPVPPPRCGHPHKGQLPVPDLAGGAGPVQEQRLPAHRETDQRPRRLSALRFGYRKGRHMPALPVEARWLPWQTP